MKIQIISGSARIESVTNRVAKHLFTELVKTGAVEAGLIDLRDYRLPPVETVFNSAEDVPLSLSQLRDAMFGADGFILVSPEYNGSYSPAMKNLLDYFPKQRHKVFGIVTASPGAMGGMRAAMQLQQLVYGLFGIGSPYMLIVPEVEKKFSINGELLDQGFRSAVKSFLEEYLWLLQRVAVQAEKFDLNFHLN